MPQKRQIGVPHPPWWRLRVPCPSSWELQTPLVPSSQTAIFQPKCLQLESFTFLWALSNFSELWAFSFLFSLKKKKQLTGGQVLCNAVLTSAIHQHESAIGIRLSPPSWTSLPPPTLSLPSRLSQSTRLSSLHHTATPHWLSVPHMAVCMLPRCSVSPSRPLLPLLRPQV